MSLEIRKEITIKGAALSEDPILYFDNIGPATSLAAITVDSLGGGTSGDMIFQTALSGVLTEAMRIGQLGQVAIGTSSIDTSAVFQVDSLNRGFLPPRTPDPETNISLPANGLMAYDTTDNEIQYYNGTSWVSLTGGGGITGSGTTNTIPIFTGATALGDSVITWSGANFTASLLTGYFRFEDASGYIQIFPNNSLISTNNSLLILEGSKGVKLTDAGGMAQSTAKWEAGTLSLLESVGGGLLEIRSSSGDIEFTESGGGVQKISFAGGVGAYTYTLPSASGTIALTSDIPTFTSIEYIALLTQVGTSAPTESVLSDTLTGGTWSYSSVGHYYYTKIGAFTNVDKVEVRIEASQLLFMSMTNSAFNMMSAHRISDDIILVKTANVGYIGGTGNAGLTDPTLAGTITDFLVDDVLSNTPITIRVWS